MIWEICPDATRVNQPFGPTDYALEWARPDVPGGHFHAGIDIGADGIHGKPVYATRPGLIVPNLDPAHSIKQCAAIGGASVFEPYLGLHCVCLLADEGVTLEYGHLDSALVSPGQRVSAGQMLGFVGTHGASCGDHLHLEVRRDGADQGAPWAAVLDPTPWLQGELTTAEHDWLSDLHSGMGSLLSPPHPLALETRDLLQGLLQQLQQTAPSTPAWSFLVWSRGAWGSVDVSGLALALASRLGRAAPDVAALATAVEAELASRLGA